MTDIDKLADEGWNNWKPRQLTLFDVPAKPRRPPRVLMHVADAGWDGGQVINWWCSRCNHMTGWVPAETRVRPPCPRCNVEGLTDE